MISRVQAVVQTEDGWLHFHEPTDVIEARSPDHVVAAIARVDAAVCAKGLFAAGFVSYEAGAAYGLSVSDDERSLPLVWFALFDQRHVRLRHTSDPASDPTSHTDSDPTSHTGYRLGEVEASVGRAEYERAFARVRRHLADGDTYQANYTFRLECAFCGNEWGLFRDLVAAQDGRHSAFIDMGSHVICSASPELFFSRVPSSSGAPAVLTARPMKGTARRGRTLEEDRRERDGLRASAKQQAENVMIVDMLRNDLGRIAEVGSVTVPTLFDVERYPNAWQMTSLITAKSTATLGEIFAALHPSASVTGAPKIRTVRILSSLERGPRGVYTGAVGYVAPGGRARFNVAIRTAIVDRPARRVAFGIGSGIVWDSDPADEYQECLLKGSILAASPARFELLETMRWDGQGFFLLERHLDRMADSAEYFGFRLARGAAREALRRAAAGWCEPQRVRLLASREGDLRVEHTPLRVRRSALTLALAARPVDEADRFLFHKTTNRAVYDQLRVEGADDTILWNSRGEVTEAITGNLIVEIDGRWVTPPVSCGLLAGTYRAELLARGGLEEAAVSLGDLSRATQIRHVNSVHETRAANLVIG